MRVQIAFKAFVASLLVSALAGCGGSGFGSGTTGGTTGGSSSSTTGSTTGGSTSVPNATPVYIDLSVGTGTTNSSSTAVTYPLVVSVADANHGAVTGSNIKFSATLGSIAVTNSATDATGAANAVLTVPFNQAAGNYTITATDEDVSGLTSSVPFDISTTSAPNYALGTLSSSGAFTSGTISIGQTPLAAGGSSGLSVNIVDTANSNAIYTDSASVTFSSPCISKGLATLSASPVTSSSGTFNTTYKAAGCSGNDTITATTVVNGTTLTATGTINVSAASLGSLQFTSPVTQTTIGLKGTGQNETATVTFTVFDANGNPVPNQVVNFSLSTSVGGLALTPASATSNSSGVVDTIVSSGTVHTTVRVIATATKADGTTLTSQSNQITVSTGFPTENGMSISATKLNLQGDDFDGNTSTITARLSDRYNNPVPDGTAVSFTTECGQVDPQCTTSDGTCTVNFTTQNPRTGQLAAVGTNVYKDNSCTSDSSGNVSNNVGCNDHRCTVLATAIGEESFNDCNGTGQYVSKDNSSNNPTQCPNGDFFVSLPEAFLDSNEDNIFEGDFETYLDFNQNGKYDAASGKFVGLLCSDPDCETNTSGNVVTSLNVSKSLVIVMTSSAVGVVTDQDTYNIPLGQTATVTARLFDSAGQVAPVGTTVVFSLSSGTASPGTFTMPNTNVNTNIDGAGTLSNLYPINVSVTAPTTSTSGKDNLVITVTTPSPDSLVSTFSVPITYSSGT